MARANPLMMFAKHIAADLAAGGPGQGVAMAFAMLDGLPDAAEQLVELIVAESRRKKPDGELIDALALMLGQALESLRFAVESGHADAAARVDALRTRLIKLGDKDALGPEVLILMIRQFTIANLDPGEALRNLLAERMGEAAGLEEQDGDPLEPLLAMAAEVEDEFSLFSLFQEMIGALPDEHRAMLAAVGFAPAAPTPGLDRLREATLGWLFDPATSVRQATAALLGAAVERGMMSGTMLRRMITLRNWMPAGERGGLDVVVQAGRRKGIAVAPLGAAQVREVFATGWDGAGAQSIFLVVKDGRRFAVAALLLKQEFGVRDAWVQRGETRRGVDDLLANVEEQVGLFRSTVDYAVEAAAFALGINAASGSVPPFGLLDVVEIAGLANLQPEARTVDTVLASLTVPSGLLAPEADVIALRASATWTRRYPFTQSWFESGGAVDALLKGKRIAKAKAVDLVLDRVLEDRRWIWAERMAWTAATLRSPETDRPAKPTDSGAADWADFAVVARALRAGRPLRDLPIMVEIAKATVEVFAEGARR